LTILVVVGRENDSELVQIILSCEFVATLQSVVTPKNVEISANGKLLSLQEVLSVCLTRLVQGKVFGKFLSSEGDREWVLS
jgi:hypothetical protein